MIESDSREAEIKIHFQQHVRTVGFLRQQTPLPVGRIEIHGNVKQHIEVINRTQKV